ncbi:MAG: branched-chain amino acid transaminase [Acidobacteriota bacterium]|nr:branched-chain amino acid transaminase [Acidobacteriota bacterium]
MDDTRGYAWLDGKMVPLEDANVHIKAHSLHYGLGVFEGTRFYAQSTGGRAVFRLEDHLRRLEGSAKIVQLDMLYGRQELHEASLDLVRKCGLESGYLRHLVFLGAGPMGLYPKGNPIHTSILCWPWGAYLGEEGLSHGIRCKISSFSRHSPNATLLKAKATGNYLNSILAKREAVGSGYDEAILLDAQGNVTEGSGENLFIVRHGRLETPPLTSVLAGITRDTIMQLAIDEGLEVRQQYFARDEVYLADEVFLTGTAAELTPVREVDDRQIGEGRPGPVTRRLQELFFRVIRGQEERYRHWLAPVDEAAASAAGAGVAATDEPVAAN